MSSLFSTVLHRYFRVPYVLRYTEFRSPKKPIATLVFIHGIGNTLHSWDAVVEQLPSGVRAIGIDLLGFGDSPKPAWATYNAKTQARSVAMTLLRLGVLKQSILVGHSLGALVAVDIARRHPLLVGQLVLCSPPFYGPESNEQPLIKSQEDLLRSVYRTAKKYPEQLAKLSALAVTLGLANKSLSINEENTGSYFAALEASIINQTSLDDISMLKLPITIMYGALDPVVVSKHITTLGKEHPNITVKRLLVGHELVGGYVTGLAKRLSKIVAASS